MQTKDPRRRIVREILCVDRVEGGEVLGGRAEHIALHHIVERGPPAAAKALLELLHDQFALPLDRGAGGDLAGVAGSNGGRPETKIMLPARVTGDAGASALQQLEIGSTRTTSRFMTSTSTEDRWRQY